MGISELLGKFDVMLGGNLAMDQHPIQGGVGDSNTPGHFILWKPGQAPVV